MSSTPARSGWKHLQRLTPEQGRRICDAIASGVPQVDLARRFGVSVDTIRNVAKGKYVFSKNN